MRNPAFFPLASVSVFCLLALSACSQLNSSNGPASGTMPQDAAAFNNHHYKVMPDHHTWHLAKAQCEQMGGHLVSITTAAEDDFVRSLCKGEDVWLGGSDEAKEGDWQWVTGEPFAFKHWAGTQPDNDQGVQHSLVYSKGQAWDDNSAGIRWKYMCEWER